MKTHFAFACFVFAATGLAWGQPMRLLLYKTAGPDGKYVLVLSRTYSGGANSSDVITSDSFVVRQDDSVYEVTFTNGVRLHAETTVVSSPSARTNFVQATIPCGIICFPTNTEVLFDNSMTDLGHIRLGGVSSTNKVEHQGDATMPHQGSRAQQQSPRNANLIAHIEHKGRSFSISIDPQDDSFLKIVVPEKFHPSLDAPRPPLRLRAIMRDDSVIEGVAKENPPWTGSGGWADVTYRFALGRRTSADGIHSITIWIRGEPYVALPF